MTKSKRRVLVQYQKQETKLNTNCRSFPSQYKDNRDAPVMCTETEKLFTGKCATCGWNPIVKAERLKKMYGEKKADQAVEYSKSITENTNPEYRKKWGNYKPTRKGDDDV